MSKYPSPKKALSPYKKTMQRNAEHVAYKHLNELEPNKPHKLYNIFPSNEKYGEGYLMYFVNNKKQRMRAYMPKKYLAIFTKEDIETFKNDIQKQTPPYLIFRQKLADGSFELDFMPEDANMITYFNDWADVPNQEYKEDEDEEEL